MANLSTEQTGLEVVQHNILLIISTAIFILFITGLAVPVEVPRPPVIISPG